MCENTTEHAINSDKITIYGAILFNGFKHSTVYRFPRL